ncbi:MAG: hypothetical protein ABSD08_01715 [Xanthobacteraceae bacterium]
MAGASHILQAMRSSDTSLPFQRLVPFNWAGELLVICAGMLTSFLVAGFWYPYWRIADMDYIVVYNAFLLNDHLPQEYFDHPGYLSILLLSYWLRALHSVGMIHVQSLSAVPPLSDAAGFADAWTQATRAGRVLSLIFAMGFVVAFSYLLRALVRDWRIAALGGFLLAFSGGMAMQMREMRTELLAVALFMIALLMLIVAAKRGQRAWRPAIVGFASLLITLAMLNKIQIFFLICALPVLLLPFGPDAASRPGFWDAPRRAWPALAASAAIALLAAYLAKDIVIYGFSDAGAAMLQLPVLRIGAQTYWAVIAVCIGLGMAAYGIIWRLAPLEALAAMFAAVAGCMIGLLALYARYNPNNVVVVFHPLEQMLLWASAANPQLATGTSFLDATHLRFLVGAVAGVIARRTFILHTSSRPTIFLEWFVVAATVIAIRRREWRLVLAVAALMLTDWGVDTLDIGRGLKQEYFNLTDPLVIIAAALLISNLTDLQHHRWTYPLGVALIAAHIVVSQAEPLKHAFKTGGPDVLCRLYHYTKRVERFPFCQPQPAPSQ